MKQWASTSAFRREEEDELLRCPLFLLFYPLISGQKQVRNSSQVLLNGLNLFCAVPITALPPSSSFYFSCYLHPPSWWMPPSPLVYLSISICHSPSLSSPPASLPVMAFPLSQGDGGGCVWVSESTPQGLYSLLAWKIHDSQECVCVCVCAAHALSGKREHRETEKKEKRVGDGGQRVWDKLMVHSRANSACCDYTTACLLYTHLQTPSWPVQP